jgi:hypothetical protein
VKRQRQKWTRGPTPQAGAGQGWAAPPGGVVALWSGSLSSSVFWKLREISGCLALVSSNSENISCAENRELALWHIVNRLVSENA